LVEGAKVKVNNYFKNLIDFQMFKKSVYILPFSLVFVLVLACSPKTYQFEKLMDGISAKPGVLELHRDSIRFSIQGAIPLEYLSKDTKISLYPEYVYGEGALRFDEIVPFDGAYEKVVTAARVDKTYVVPFISGMESGQLILKGVVERKQSPVQVPSKILAIGLETTPRLVRYGLVFPDEPIPFIGKYMEREFFEGSGPEEKVFFIRFDQGSAQKQDNPIPLQMRDYILQVEPGKRIAKVVVTGLQSPESKDDIGGLAKMRADFVSERLKNNRSLKNLTFETSYRYRDWFDLRQLLADYEGFDESEKEDIYRILVNEDSYANQLKALQRTPYFQKISRELFPDLRAAKVIFVLEPSLGNGEQVAASAYAKLNDRAVSWEVTEGFLVQAAQKAQKLDEKEAIYKKLTELHPSDYAFNNLGVVYLNLAQRELDTKKRNDFIMAALNSLRQANRIRSNSITLHNIGRAYLLRQDIFAAYVAISEASAMENDESNAFLMYNEGIRGALDILNGDYRLATIRLNRATESEDTYFNKGIAHYMTQEYRLAAENFENAVQANRDSGFGFYGLALVAAANNDETALFENLEKAVSRSESLKQYALRDVNFGRFRDRPEFLQVFKSVE
jgi:tetratricopeptide (TPR) repeat protein